MKEIPLNHGYVALVDDADYAAASQFNWRAEKRRRTVYASRSVWNSTTETEVKVYLHRFLLPDSNEVLHMDGNGLNNQRGNIVSGTTQQNRCGVTAKREGTSSRFRGVSLYRRDGNWQAKITLNRKQMHLGFFDTQEEAAEAYDTAAVRLFGKFAAPNFPQAQPIKTTYADKP